MGNLVSEDKYTRTTTGMEWQNVAAYTYDETNRMVSGKNEQGEYSIYTYNGLGMRVGRELIMKDNTHGYTDFHDLTPSVDTGIDKPEVVKESYVIDYTSATFNPLTMDEDGGFSYRWVYGLDKLSVKITSEGTNWWGQNVKEDILKDYLHQDRLGSTTNLTDQFGRVVGRADYNEWGEITYREALDITSSYRRIWPQSSYTGHDWDDVLGMYYAKARFYSAEDKRFVAVDPVKGQIIEPLSLVPYVYCVDNPLRWVDPLGTVQVELISYAATYEDSDVTFGQRVYGKQSIDIAEVRVGNKKITVFLNDENTKGGKIYVDDSLFVDAFGAGGKLVVYYDEDTNNVSIRASFDYRGNDAYKIMPGSESEEAKYGKSYSSLFLEGIEKYWTGTFGGYNVSTYARYNGKGIKAKFKDELGISKVRFPYFFWYTCNPGIVTMYSGDPRNSSPQYTAEEYQWVAAHEFGHLLGVADAYNSKEKDEIVSIYNKFWTEVQENDIRKVLTAWDTGELQKWP